MKHYNFILPTGFAKNTATLEFFKKEFDMKPILFGDLFRNQLKKDDAFTEELKYYLDNGKVLPDALSLKVVLSGIDQLKNNDIILADYPHNYNQLMLLIGKLKKGLKSQINVWYFKQLDLEEFYQYTQQGKNEFDFKGMVSLKYVKNKIFRYDKAYEDINKKKNDDFNLIKVDFKYPIDFTSSELINQIKTKYNSGCKA